MSPLLGASCGDRDSDMMSVKKKSRLWPIWGCLCSVAWATCSGIIRLSLKISSGFSWVVSLVPWLIRESSLAGFRGVCEGWEFPRGRAVESPVATAAEDWGWDPGVGGWLRGDTRFAGKEGGSCLPGSCSSTGWAAPDPGLLSRRSRVRGSSCHSPK